MKKPIFILILSLFSCGALVAQQSDIVSDKQIIVLKGGEILTGTLEDVDEKLIQISNENDSFTIKKKRIYQIFPQDVHSDSDVQSNEVLVQFKNKKWLKTEAQALTKKFVLLKSDESFVLVRRSKILKIYPADHASQVANQNLKVTGDFTQQGVIAARKKYVPKQLPKFYNITQLSYYQEKNDNPIRASKFNIGNGVQHTVGYRLTQNFGVGVHVGFTKYSANGFVFLGDSDSDFTCSEFCSNTLTDGSKFSTGLAIRGALGRKKIRPYYNLEFEFNRILRGQELRQDIDLVENGFEYSYNEDVPRLKWGHIFYPSVGIQVKMKSMDFLVDFGYQIGNLNYENGKFNFGPGEVYSTQMEQNEIKGFVLRVGLML